MHLIVLNTIDTPMMLALGMNTFWNLIHTPEVFTSVYPKEVGIYECLSIIHDICCMFLTKIKLIY